MKSCILILMIVASLVGCSEEPLNSDINPSVSSPTSEKKVEEKVAPDFSFVEDEKNQNISEDGLIIVDDPESINVIVNKQRKLPEGYTPPELTVPAVPFYFDEYHQKKQMRKEAARALEELFKAAKKDGKELVAASGYRSYERQKSIYQRNVKVYGEEKANTFSAKPGTSEHQTGLAMDVTSAQVAFKLEESFSETEAGDWLANHVHEFGFVVRYPEGKSDITGYTYEPWHLRYVGKDISTQIEAGETLEEYFGFYPSPE